MAIATTISRPADASISAREPRVEPIVVPEHLWKPYRAGKLEDPALRGVNFKVLPGAFVSAVELSAGAHERLAIAGAPTNAPRSILGEERTRNPDTKNSEIVLSMLRQLNK